MSDHTARYEALIDRLVAWAGARPDVHGAFIVGSRARSTRPADEWSDLDAVIFAEDPASLLDDETWVTELGAWEISFREPTAVGIWEERRVLFADGCDADFSILPARLIDELELEAEGSVFHAQAAEVLVRGYRILADPSGRLAPLFRHMVANTIPVDERPTQESLDQLLSDFWYHCPWTARKLRRGELAVAHECLDGHQRRLVLQLIRWLASVDGNTWHETRFFEEWAPAGVNGSWAMTFAHHDAADIVRALGAMMDLVSRVGNDVGDAYGFDVNPRPEQAARHWVTHALDG